MSTHDSDLNADIFIYDELSRLRSYIQEATQSMSHMGDNLSKTGMAEAQTELINVVKATEEAATRIIDAAAEINKLIKGSEQQKEIVEQTTIILESSSFQDLTGQRLNKVLKMIVKVEEVVDSILLKLNPVGVNKKSVDWQSDDKRFDKNLMNGPQSDQERSSQEDVDALLKT